MQDVFGRPSTCLGNISLYLVRVLATFAVQTAKCGLLPQVTCKYSYYLSPLVCAPAEITIVLCSGCKDLLRIYL